MADEATPRLKKTLSKHGTFTQPGVEAVLTTQQVANPDVAWKQIDLTATYPNDLLGG